MYLFHLVVFLEGGVTDLLIHKLSVSLTVSRPLDPNKLRCLATWDLTDISPRTRITESPGVSPGFAIFFQNPMETGQTISDFLNHQSNFQSIDLSSLIDRHSYFRPGKGTTELPVNAMSSSAWFIRAILAVTIVVIDGRRCHLWFRKQEAIERRKVMNIWSVCVFVHCHIVMSHDQ